MNSPHGKIICISIPPTHSRLSTTLSTKGLFLVYLTVHMFQIVDTKGHFPSAIFTWYGGFNVLSSIYVPFFPHLSSPFFFPVSVYRQCYLRYYQTVLNSSSHSRTVFLLFFSYISLKQLIPTYCIALLALSNFHVYPLPYPYTLNIYLHNIFIFFFSPVDSMGWPL